MYKKIFNSILILFFIFIFPKNTFSNELTDFEIEGFSINLNLIDYFNSNQIKKEMNSEFAVFYKDNRYVDISVGKTDEYPMRKNLNIYDEVMLTVKPEDNKFKIYAVGGTIKCETKTECEETSNEIVEDLKNYFGNNIDLNTWEDPHESDESGNSMVYGNEFIFNSTKDSVNVNFYHFEKEFADRTNTYENYIVVSISTFEFDEFLKKEAYN